MSKSKFDILFALATAFFCGCDALRTPVPDELESPIRASFAGFVVEGRSPRISIARPLDDASERSVLLPWIDQNRSTLQVEHLSDTGWRRMYLAGIYTESGLKGEAYGWLSTSETIDRLRGCLRWNASTPYTFSDDAMVADSFDLRPQPSSRVRFLRDGVRGDLCLRWPKLASAMESSLHQWSWDPDSLKAFLDDWIAVSKGRGDPEAKILLLDTTSIPYVYRWNDPDTSVLRKVLRGASAQTIFAEGDSIWLPSDRSASLLVNLDKREFSPVLLDRSLWTTTASAGFLAPSVSNGTTMETGSYSPMEFSLSNSSTWWSSSNPVRVVIQIAGTCPAFADWRRYGPTDRWHRPTGNVAPFDGYLCELFPDTLSFPRGMLLQTPRDTSSQPQVVTVDTSSFQPVLVNP